MNPLSNRWRWLVPAAAALLAAACAQTNGDVNRVQPNVVKKTDLLDGEWFFRNTVTYTPFNTQFTYPGQTGSMEKLVWEVQEQYLVGYRSYPYTPGAESNVDPSSTVSGTTAKYCDKNGVCTGGHKYYGSPVVAFPITSQFDIQRGYNPATGEQTNVIAENTTDRPWNQREYIRVSWSANVLNKNSGMNWGTVQNPAGGSTNSNWIQPNEAGEDPYDWPTFEYTEKDGKQALTYFDVTGRYMANPDMTYFDGYGWVPLCYFASGVYDCSSSEIKMRTSISKVDRTWSRDYEPLVYPNDLMSLFGYFRTERLNYDRMFGYNDSAVIRLAQRHRVWSEYYQKTAAGDVDVTQPIPAAQRKTKPIVYYFTPAARMGGADRYAEFWEPGRTLEKEYDRAFRRAIGAAQGKDPAQVEQMFYLCNNPVTASDPAACGSLGFSPKVGDLRYSFVNTVAEPVANGLLGYGPSSSDPETGQLISGMSNTYLWGVDLYGRNVTDWILVLEGERSVNDYISGADMKSFIQHNPTYNIAQVRKENANAIQSELQGIPQRSTQTQGAWDRPTDRVVSVLNQLNGAQGLPKASRDELRAASDLLAQSPQLEASVLDNPDVQSDLANLLPPFAQEAAKADPAFARKASRALLTNIQASDAWNKSRLEWVSKNNIYLAEFFDHTLVGLALEKLNYRKARVLALTASGMTVVDAKAQADNEIAKQVRQSVWLATALHETGHTFNLRHNFQGSYDAVNYKDVYWDLRKPTITVAQDSGGVTVNKLPRTPTDLKNALDGTETQQLSGMHNYEYSSIMDYAGKIYGDWQGIGKYDEAAIIFAYSGTSEAGGTGAASPGYVEVFNSARKDSKSFPGSDGNMMTISGAGADLPMVNVTHTNPNVRNYTERFHYSTVPLHFGEGPDIDSVIADGITKLRSRKLVKWSEVKSDEDKVAAALRSDPTLLNDPDRAAGLLGSPMLRVPYMFCSDESADGPVLSCNRFDRGPDYYEMVRTKLEDYWNYYIDSHFRRDKAFFNGNSALNSAYRTFMFTADNYKHWVYEFYNSASRNQEQVVQYKIDPILQDSWTMSVLDGVNQHLNVMSVPPFGLFMYRNLKSGPRWDMVSEGDDFDMLNADGTKTVEDYYSSNYGAQDFAVLNRGLGRRMYSRYDFKSGFGFWNRMLESGHYNDQVGAMFAAVIPGIEFQGVDITADQNRYNIPYYLVFRKEFSDTFGALWASDEAKIRPILYKTLDPAGRVTDQTSLYWRVYVQGNQLFQGFNYPAAVPDLCNGTQRPPGCLLPEQRPAPANIQLTWTSRIYSLYLGMALFRVNFDLDYAKANQVYKLGGTEAFTVASGYHTVEVPDIVTGSRYLAVEKDGAGVDSSPAIRAIGIANEYLRMVNDPTICPLSDFLTVQGYVCMPAAQANNAALVEERKKYWLQVYQDSVRDLDLMRGFYTAYGKAF